MINDNQIDLTMDSRFGNSSWRGNYAAKAFDKLFRRNNRHSDLFYKLCKPSTDLPWNLKNSDYNTSQKLKPKRSYKDWISDDFGVTIRLTEDNTILSFGNRIVNPLVLEEYFMETLGYLPYESIGICYECGRKKIVTLKNKNSWGSCEFHKLPRLPWEYRRVNDGVGL